jgi:hypothetical protein
MVGAIFLCPFVGAGDGNILTTHLIRCYNLIGKLFKWGYFMYAEFRYVERVSGIILF